MLRAGPSTYVVFCGRPWWRVVVGGGGTCNKKYSGELETSTLYPWGTVLVCALQYPNGWLEFGSSVMVPRSQVVTNGCHV